jgi:hypothetical protein
LKEHIMSDTTHNSQPRTPDKRHHEQDSLSRVTWASIFVLAGLVFFANNFGYLPTIEGVDSFRWVMLGAGGLLLLENVIRVFSVDHRGPHLFGLGLGVVLLGSGTAAIFGVDLLKNWLPLVLIGLGLLAIARGLRD